jgi:hypothetical protein
MVEVLDPLARISHQNGAECGMKFRIRQRCTTAPAPWIRGQSVLADDPVDALSGGARRIDFHTSIQGSDAAARDRARPGAALW